MMNTLSVLIALCCTCLAAVQSVCDRDAPDDCTFERWDDPCNWNRTSQWIIYPFSSNQQSLGLSGHHKSVERLQSGTACATRNAVHCLKFEYRFEDRDVVKLSVIVKTTGVGEHKVWEASSSYGWENAQVPVRTRSEFSIIVEARSSTTSRAFIDEIRYVNEACDIQPTDAVPPPTIRATTTSPTTLAVGLTSNTTLSQAGKPSSFSSNIGLLVGVCVAVVCLLVIGIVLCILFRRKRLCECKTCCRAQKQKEEECRVNTSHNAVLTQEREETERFLRVDINPENSERSVQWHRHSDTSPTSSSPTENYYSVIESPTENNNFKFSISERAQANNPKKCNDPDLQQGHQSSRDVSYDEITDHTVSISKTPGQQPASPFYQNIPNVAGIEDHEHKRGPARDSGEDSDLPTEDQSAGAYLMPKGTAISKSLIEPYEVRELCVLEKQDPTAGNHYFLPGQTSSKLHPESSQTSNNYKTGQYQRLDFEGNELAEETKDDVSGLMYHHLNEGDEGSYDEIERDRRKEVVGEDYSHI